MLGAFVRMLPSRVCGHQLRSSTSCWHKVRSHSARPMHNLVHTKNTPSSSKSLVGRTFASSGGGGPGGNGAGKGTGGPSGEPGDSGSSKSESWWATYLRLTEEFPLLTKGATCAVLNAVGDLASQVLVEKNKVIDTHRLLVFSTLGALLVAPALHFWYGTLAKVVTVTGTKGALIRLALDQLAFAPFFNGLFISVLLTVEGQSHNVVAKLKQDLIPTVQANWVLWVPAQYINFNYVPQTLQVLFANVVAVAWNTYLSFASHKKLE